MLCIRLVAPHRIPIIRQPATFTVNVPHGKSLTPWFMASDIRYLQIPPIPLPIPTKMISFIIRSIPDLCLQKYKNNLKSCVLFRINIVKAGHFYRYYTYFSLKKCVENPVENSVQKCGKTKRWPSTWKNDLKINRLFSVFPHFYHPKKLWNRLENHISTLVDNTHKLLKIRKKLWNHPVNNSFWSV